MAARRLADRAFGPRRRRMKIDPPRKRYVLDLYAAPGGFAVVMPSPDAPVAIRVEIPGGFMLSDHLGVDQVIPHFTNEPVSPGELVAMAREGRHGFGVAGEAKGVA